MREHSACVVPLPASHSFHYPQASLSLLAWALAGRLSGLAGHGPVAAVSSPLTGPLQRWLESTKDTRGQRTELISSMAHAAESELVQPFAHSVKRQCDRQPPQPRLHPHASVPTPRSTACSAGAAAGGIAALPDRWRVCALSPPSASATENAPTLMWLGSNCVAFHPPLLLRRSHQFARAVPDDVQAFVGR
jgi:hypothetical protein